MSAFKGTPGPWVYKPATGKMHALMAIGGNVVIFKIAPDAADARLMEAAPDLLEALQDALCALECCGKDYPAATKANAAIAKALGEQP